VAPKFPAVKQDAEKKNRNSFTLKNNINKTAPKISLD
jgi:hypothetical protein